MAAIAAGAQGTILLSLSILQAARFEYVGPKRYMPGALDQLTRVLGAPVFLFFRPEWTSWLRPYVGDDRWIVLCFIALNALVWGAVLGGSIWWWQRSLARQRRLGVAAVAGTICLVIVLFATGVIYCHGGFSGILHCHSFATPDHDH